MMLSLPFALVGGIWFVWLLGYNWSVAVAIGFIALAGVAAETGVVMLIYLDHAWQARRAHGRPRSAARLVRGRDGGRGRAGASQDDDRHRDHGGPAADSLGAGTGASVMKRIAAPMVGGMVSSTVLTLVVIPAIYSLWKEREVRAASGSDSRVVG